MIKLISPLDGWDVQKSLAAMHGVQGFCQGKGLVLIVGLKYKNEGWNGGFAYSCYWFAPW